MTQEEKQQRISALEAELEQLKKPEKTPAQRFWELVSGTTLKFDFGKYPNTLFGFREDQYVWEYDLENHALWLGYSTVWSILKDEFGLDHDGVQRVIKNEVEEHFKCKGVTPVFATLRDNILVEEHFKCKGVTPALRNLRKSKVVEDHSNGRSEAKEASNQSVLEYIILELLEALGYDRSGNLQDKNKLEGLTDFQINAINMALDQVHASVACSFVGFEQVMRTLRKRFYKK